MYVEKDRNIFVKAHHNKRLRNGCVLYAYISHYEIDNIALFLKNETSRHEKKKKKKKKKKKIRYESDIVRLNADTSLDWTLS